MSDLVQIDKFPVRDVLKQLLKDKTTGKNIIFATDMYLDYGYDELSQMTEPAILGFDSCDIQPRVCKAQAEQNLRTRKKAEVFTPTWLCNMMNNFCDSEWFGREDVFNRTDSEHHWYCNSDRIMFPEKKSWKQYVDSRRLEITCGEAPYLVSRYDTTTGELIPIKERVGLLDRKLRVINENAADEAEWLKWAERAFNSIYGYEFQGDNLLIARINLLMTFCDYLKDRWDREATKAEIKKFANIISWNLWQMDGLSDTVPVGIPEDSFEQMTLFGENEKEIPSVDCKIQDWRDKCPKIFKKIKDKNERGVNMKFDFVIGNPPYQESQDATSDKPVYNFFIDVAYDVADKVELITPARFLFNAGKTPKVWNEKMLYDEHLKILYYEQDSSKVFANTDIKGGVAITYHDSNNNYGAIEHFIPNQTLREILIKVRKQCDLSLSSVINSTEHFKLSQILHEENPDAINQMSKGHQFDLTSNILDKNSSLFYENKPDDGNDYVRVYGRQNNQRVMRYIKKTYLQPNEGIGKYKVVLPESNNNGTFGETLVNPFVAEKDVVTTQTFITMAFTDEKNNANATLKYICGKFARALLGTLKITQHNKRETWRNVPMQDFSENSDIDWSKSIPEIDKQLYKKYGLTQEEIDFIESHVKEMT